MLGSPVKPSSDSVNKGVVFLDSLSAALVRSSIRLSYQILLARCLMNSLSSVDETFREYSTAPSDDLIGLWRSKVKVTTGRRDGEGIRVDAVVSKSCCM